MSAEQIPFAESARHMRLRGIEHHARAVKVTRVARQNAATIAGLPLTTECLLADISATGAIAA